MRADPTEPMQIATKHYVDNSIATNSVLYTAQSLTEEQKEQARKNIGAQDENNGLTPVTVTYINPFYNTTDTSTTYLLQGTLKVFDDNSPTDVKKAFTIVMNVLGGHATPTGTSGCRDLFDKFRILYDNGLITIPFKAYPNKYDRNYWVSLSAYQNKYIFFNCVRSDKADGFNVTLRYDLETNAYVENSCYSEQAVKSSLKGLTGTPTIMQVQMQSDPTADKEIATKQYVDNSIAASGTDISLGLTSATVGQTIKVKAVDENGKPTEWEAVEMAGDKWELINEITFSESANGCVINTDSNGAAFSLKAVKVECVIQIDESDPFTYIKAKYNNLTVSSNTTTSLKSGQAYFSSGALCMGSAGIMEIHTGVLNNNYNWTYTISKMGFRYNNDWEQNSISQIKIEPNDGGKPLGTGTKIYVYGVRT